jgi:hypothetical protein
MNDPYGLASSGLPSDIAADGRKLTRQQQVAQALMQQSMQPLAMRNTGRLQAAPHWLEGAAKLAQAYAARKGMETSEQGFSDLGRRYQTGLASEVQRIAAMRQGQPIQPDPQEVEQSQDQGTPAPRVGSTGDPRGAVQAALASQYGPVREMGKLDFQADLKTQENAAARIARLEEREMVLEASSRNDQLDRESKERIAKESNAVKEAIAELKALMGKNGQDRSPFYTFLPTPEGYVAGNARDGTVSQVMLGGKPVIRSGDSPKLQGDIAGAKEHGTASARRAFNMAGIGGVIQKAEDLLGGKQKPTGSGFGSLVDTVTGFVGVSPAGAKEAQQLKAVAGALTSKMPRMEGPQSDADRKQYEQMAAMVGDDTVPVDRRQAALKVVKDLWQKYEKLNPDAFAPGALPSAPPGAAPNVRVVDW